MLALQGPRHGAELRAVLSICRASSTLQLSACRIAVQHQLQPWGRVWPVIPGMWLILQPHACMRCQLPAASCAVLRLQAPLARVTVACTALRSWCQAMMRWEKRTCVHQEVLECLVEGGHLAVHEVLYLRMQLDLVTMLGM